MLLAWSRLPLFGKTQSADAHVSWLDSVARLCGKPAVQGRQQVGEVTLRGVGYGILGGRQQEFGERRGIQGFCLNHRKPLVEPASYGVVPGKFGTDRDRQTG